MTDWFTTFDRSLWLKAAGNDRKEAAFIRKALRLRKGHRVLDCPCGEGRIAALLARAGCRVVGVDREAGFVRRARALLRRRRPRGDAIRMDMRKLDFDGRFDAAFNWFGSFGYFSDAENLDVLRRLARAVRPGGRVLIDQVNRWFVLRHFARKQTRGAVTIFPHWAARTQRLEATWIIPRGAKTRKCFSSIRAYTLSQFRRMFARAGLTMEAVYGGPDGSKYGPLSRRVIVVGRRALPTRAAAGAPAR